MSGGRTGIAAAFARASDYDRHARVQRIVAEGLADRIAGLKLPRDARILEIGCGTGFLTQALLARGVSGQWLVTDIAPAMVARCRKRLGGSRDIDFAVLDGEQDRPPGAGSYDLVCSSLALQWFDDPASAATRMMAWLAPGGWLAFTSLLAGTFAEWRGAHEAEGLEPGSRSLPERGLFDALMPELQADAHRVVQHVDACGDARGFLRSLRAIGAQTPDAGHRPLGAAAMRRVMRRFSEAGGSASYEVIECLYHKGS